MGKRLESIGRPIDADVEKNGAKEIRWDNDSKDSYDFLFDAYEIEELGEEDLARRKK